MKSKKMSQHQLKLGKIKLVERKFFKELKTIYGDNLKHLKITSSEDLFLHSICPKLSINNTHINRNRLYSMWKRFEINYKKTELSAENSQIENSQSIHTDIDIALEIENVVTMNEENNSEIEKSNTGLKSEDIVSLTEHSWDFWGSLYIDIDITKKYTVEDVRLSINRSITSAGISCVLSYRTLNLNKKQGILVQYAKCKYPNHVKQYKFKIMPSYKMSVYSKGDDIDNHGPYKVFTQLRGEDRKELQMKLKSESAYLVGLQQFSQVDEILLQKGNTQNIRKTTIPVKLNRKLSVLQI